MSMTFLRNLHVIHFYLLTMIFPVSSLFGFDGFGGHATGGNGGKSP
jgi:hypothetical protein